MYEDTNYIMFKLWHNNAVTTKHISSDEQPCMDARLKPFKLLL